MSTNTGKKSPLNKIQQIQQIQRLPAPTLFVGPPSRNASSTSLVPPTAGDSLKPTPRAPLTRQPSRLRADQIVSPIATGGDSGSSILSPDVSKPSPFGRRQPPITISSPTQGENGGVRPVGTGGGIDAKSAAKTDAMWTEMQNTLKEVELNAGSGSHVFSSWHAKALDELRAAQISLAQAWARSEADEEATRNEEVDTIKQGSAEHQARLEELSYEEALVGERVQKLGLSLPGGVGHGLGPPRSRASSGASVRSANSGMNQMRGGLEQETENDIQLARRRRAANDKYFQRAQASVQDVVAKLEEVRDAMKEVEVESREIWGDARRGSATDSASIGVST